MSQYIYDPIKFYFNIHSFKCIDLKKKYKKICGIKSSIHTYYIFSEMH